MSQDVSPAPSGAPWHLWLVGVLGLLWNSVGAFDYLMTQAKSEPYMDRLTPQQLEVFNHFPLWLVAFWGCAVLGGVLGSLLLLLRKRLAMPVLLVSFLAMTATAFHNAFFANGLYATGGTGPAFVLLIFAIALGLWFYTHVMGKQGVLV